MAKYLDLDANSYTHETTVPDPTDKWDRASTSTSWDVNGLILKEKDAYKALPCADDVKQGDEFYVVYAVYSTGDSFGHDEGASLEFISYHKNPDLAFENKKAMESHSDGQIQIKLDNGETVQRYCPWDGYFECLDYVQVDKFMVR
jgi:hypothetical protein